MSRPGSTGRWRTSLPWRTERDSRTTRSHRVRLARYVVAGSRTRIGICRSVFFWYSS